MYTFDKLNASVSSEQKEVIKHLPARLTSTALVQLLEKLGFAVPMKIAGAAKDIESLRASGFTVSVKSVDEAIAKRCDLSICNRLRLKYALNAAGVLR